MTQIRFQRSGLGVCRVTGVSKSRDAVQELCNPCCRRWCFADESTRITRFSKLKRWAMDVAKRRGAKRAKVALARKIAVILHRMWVNGSTYRWTETQPIAAQM